MAVSNNDMYFNLQLKPSNWPYTTAVDASGRSVSMI